MSLVTLNLRFLRILLVFLSATSRADSCNTALNDVSPVDFGGSTNSAWKNPVIIQQRLDTVISHQNRIRGYKRVPLLASNFTEVLTDGKPTFLVDTIDGFLDQPVVGHFIVQGDSLVRAVHNDIYSLNFVYRFLGASLIEVKPYGASYLEGLSGPNVVLYRKMSQKEYQIWKSKKLGELGTNWGHGTKVVHFSTDRIVTTATGPSSSPTIGIQVQRKVLLDWANNLKIWSGALDDDMLISEFVFTPAQLKELFDKDQLHFVQ